MNDKHYTFFITPVGHAVAQRWDHGGEETVPNSTIYSRDRTNASEEFELQQSDGKNA